MRKPIRDWRYVVFGIAGKVKFLKSVGTQILNAPVTPLILQGEDRVEEFLICTNEKCRFLLSLREGNKLWRRSELILSSCPECNHRWSSRCPFCVQPLEVSWQNKVQCCTHCSRPLQ